jgi:uncharacterized protein
MGERYRPHHILCERFLRIDSSGRSKEFFEAEQRVRDLIESDEETLVKAIEGIDQICQFCPDCRYGRCQNQAGGEEAVKKWDSIILHGLDIAYGETRTPKEWRHLIDRKKPLDFCRRRCSYRDRCSIIG